MKELFGENPSEMLNLLVDGELSSIQESILYSQLAINDELRTEMRELIAIKESIRSDSEAFSPPVESFSNITSSIGFNYTNTLKNNNPKTVIFYKRYLGTIITIIISALITTLIISDYYETKYTSLGNNIPIINSFNINENYVIPQDPLIKNRIETYYKKSKNDLSSAKKNNISIINKNNSKSINNKHNIQTQEIVSDNAKYNSSTASDIDLIPEIDYSNITFLQKTDHYVVNTFNAINNAINIIPISNIQNTKKYNSIGYSIHIRGQSSRSFPDIDMPSQTKPLINNMAFAGFLSAGEHHKIGIELGQEPFGQKFSSIENGYPSEFEQNPILFWAGLSYRYEFDRLNILGGFQPFAQVTVGSTELGPLGRTILGLQYFNSSGIGFSLGLEGVFLIYENQKVLYTTKKLGFTYGMFYNF